MLKKILSVLTILIGLLIIYAGFAILPDENTRLPETSEAKNLSGVFAELLASIFMVYFIAIFAAIVGMIGFAITIAGLTGLLNSTGTASPHSERAIARLAHLATIRKWLSRIGWTPILAGAGYITIQILRQKFGADLKAFDYLLNGSVFILLGLAVLFISAIGGLFARLTIRRLG